MCKNCITYIFFFLVYKALVLINQLEFGLLPTGNIVKKSDLKNAFDVLELYASDPNKQQELDEDLQSFFLLKFIN